MTLTLERAIVQLTASLKVKWERFARVALVRSELQNVTNLDIRVKKLASSGKQFGRTKNKQKQATFWKICATSVRPSGQTSTDR